MAIADKKSSRKAHKKLSKLNSNAKIQKRPLFHPPIPSPYARESQPKVVYIKPSTPFMSAINRIRGLLKQIDKRGAQSVAGQARKLGGDKILAQAKMGLAEASKEEVTVKGTGRAIQKVLEIAAWFEDKERNEGTRLRLFTSSVTAIDDIVATEAAEESEKMVEDEADDEETPESRLRQLSVLEVKISLR